MKQTPQQIVSEHKLQGDKSVYYGIDSGSLSDTGSFAWSRVWGNPNRCLQPPVVGTNYDGLVEWLEYDMSEQRQIYLGVEAPMWTPDTRGGESVGLFAHRIDWEKSTKASVSGGGNHWSTPMGGITALCALVILKELSRNISCGYSILVPGVSVAGPGTEIPRGQTGIRIIGYEAYISGDFKMNHWSHWIAIDRDQGEFVDIEDPGIYMSGDKKGQKKPNDDRWDAYCAAALGYYYQNPRERLAAHFAGRTCESATLKLITPLSTHISLWQILDVQSQRACSILGFVPD